MNISFEGIGEKPVTFISADAEKGKMVKVSAAGTVSKCAAGDTFDGQALYVEGGYASVKLSGFVKATYTGTKPAVGRAYLLADGSGGVKTDSTKAGDVKLVVDVDESAGTVTFIM